MFLRLLLAIVALYLFFFWGVYGIIAVVLGAAALLYFRD
jgi:hypothetical protein